MEDLDWTSFSGVRLNTTKTDLAVFIQDVQNMIVEGKTYHDAIDEDLRKSIDSKAGEKHEANPDDDWKTFCQLKSAEDFRLSLLPKIMRALAISDW